jgi:hypothetical protein
VIDKVQNVVLVFCVLGVFLFWSFSWLCGVLWLTLRDICNKRLSPLQRPFPHHERIGGRCHFVRSPLTRVEGYFPPAQPMDGPR